MTSQALLFPGQGAQSVGMGRDFHERFACVRELFDRANAVLGQDLGRLILEGPEDRLTLTCHCQPAVYLVSSAIVTALEEAGRLRRESIACTAGLSLGEYTALWFAGVLSFEDGLRLVAARGEAMQEASDDPPSGMVSLLGADEAKATAIAAEAAQGDVLTVANLLGPGQVVLSGAKSALARVPDVAKAHGVRRALPLNVAGAFHSPLMQPAAQRLCAALTEVELRPAQRPVYVNVSAQALVDPREIRVALERQVTEPVRWEDSMRAMIAAGVGEFIEPGPGRVLAGLLRKIDADRPVRAYDAWEE